MRGDTGNRVLGPIARAHCQKRPEVAAFADESSLRRGWISQTGEFIRSGEGI